MLVISVERDSALRIYVQVLSQDRGGGDRILARRKKRGRLTPPSKIAQSANFRFLLDASTFPIHIVDMSTPVAYDLQGQNGSTVLNAGTSYTGNIRWIQVVNDAVLGTVASASGNVANPTRLQSITLPAGLGIGGRFSSVAVTSGVVIAYFE
jgi:hypothetical protein